LANSCIGALSVNLVAKAAARTAAYEMAVLERPEDLDHAADHAPGQDGRLGADGRDRLLLVTRAGVENWSQIVQMLVN
jgi:hypothetical protein